MNKRQKFSLEMNFMFFFYYFDFNYKHHDAHSNANSFSLYRKVVSHLKYQGIGFPINITHVLNPFLFFCLFHKLSLVAPIYFRIKTFFHIKLAMRSALFTFTILNSNTEMYLLHLLLKIASLEWFHFSYNFFCEV